MLAFKYINGDYALFNMGYRDILVGDQFCTNTGEMKNNENADCAEWFTFKCDQALTGQNVTVEQDALHHYHGMALCGIRVFGYISSDLTVG